MRIAFITNIFPVLSATFILNQITGLLDLGHDVRIIAYTDPAEPKVHPDVEKYNLLAHTRYLPRIPRHKVLCMMKALWLVISNFHKGPVELLKFVKMFILRRKGLSLTRLYLLLEFIEGDFDIVQCHYGPVGIDGIFLKDAGVKAKICTAFHGFDLSRYPLIHGRNVYDDLFEKGDIFLPISEYWKKELIDMGCPSEKTIVHRMGIELDKFEYRPHDIRMDGPVRLLTIGRLVQKKGHCYAIEAVAKLVAAGRDIEYTIAGDGPLKPGLEQLVDRHNLRDRVKFLGAVDQEQVRELYRESDVFILSSITADDGDMEGVPVVLMEAMACGLPVISTLHSGIDELVTDGVSGLLATEKDVSAITEKLLCLLGNTHSTHDLAQAARQCVEREFSIDILNKRLEKIYHALVK
jgi:colanic acid/amylovoran biosynthesis glycosyltransferase